MSSPALREPAPPRWLAWLAWICAAAFFFYAWVLRVTPSVIVDQLMAELAVGGTIVGQLSAFYFYGYAGMQIPAGMLLDRFGPRRLTTVAAVVCAGGSMLFAVSDTVLGLSVARFAIGAGAAFSLVGAINISARWLPAGQFAALSGIAMMFGMAGGVFGQAPVSVAVEHFGWRPSVQAIAGIGLALALALWLTVRDGSRGAGGVGAVLGGLGEVMRRRANWLNALAGLGATGPLLGFGALWGVPYIQASLGVSRPEAAGLASLVFVGTGVGAPLVGWLSDRLRRRQPPLLIGLVLAALALSAALFMPQPNALLMGTACFLIGVGGSAQIVNFAFARERNPPALVATAIGLLNGCVTGAGALFQPAIGAVLDAVWDGRMDNGARVYELADYRIALSLLLAGLVIAFLAALGLRDSRDEALA